MGTLHVKISDTEELEVEFDTFVISPNFPLVYNDVCFTPKLIPHNDGYFRLIITNCLYFPQYNAICAVDSLFYVKTIDGIRKVQRGILKCRYKGKSGHPSNHEGLINNYDYSTLNIKEVVNSIYHPSSTQYDYQNELYVCILDVQKQQKIDFGIDGDDAVEYEIVNLHNPNERIVKGWYGGHGFKGSPQAIANITLDSGKYLIIVRQEEDVGGEGVILYWKYQNESKWRVFSVDNAPGYVYTWIPTDDETKTLEFVEYARVDLENPIIELPNDTCANVSRYGQIVKINDLELTPLYTDLPPIFNEQLYVEKKQCILIQDTVDQKIYGYFVLTEGVI